MASYMEIKGTTYGSFVVGKRGPILSQITTSSLGINALDSSTVASGGTISATGGANTSTGDGGEILLSGGAATTGGGGAIELNAGSSSAAVGGNVTLRSGTGNTAGAVSIIANNSSGGAATGGAIDITAGQGFDGGNITITAGTSTGGTAGNISLRPGSNGVINGAILVEPHSTGGGNTTDVRFLELAASGTNYVGYKAPDAIATSVIWTLPASDGAAGQYMATDGNGNLDWASSATFLYEVYASGTQTNGGTPVTLLYDTIRIPTSNFTLSAGVVTLGVGVGGTYSIEYHTSVDSTNATRDIVQSEIFINGSAYVGSRSFTYNRNTANGEGSSSKKVIAALADGDTVEVRLDVISGNGNVTIADCCNLILERKGP